MIKNLYSMAILFISAYAAMCAGAASSSSALVAQSQEDDVLIQCALEGVIEEGLRLNTSTKLARSLKQERQWTLIPTLQELCIQHMVYDSDMHVRVDDAIDVFMTRHNLEQRVIDCCYSAFFKTIFNERGNRVLSAEQLGWVRRAAEDFTSKHYNLRQISAYLSGDLLTDHTHAVLGGLARLSELETICFRITNNNLALFVNNVLQQGNYINLPHDLYNEFIEQRDERLPETFTTISEHQALLLSHAQVCFTHYARLMAYARPDDVCWQDVRQHLCGSIGTKLMELQHRYDELQNHERFTHAVCNRNRDDIQASLMTLIDAPGAERIRDLLATYNESGWQTAGHIACIAAMTIPTLVTSGMWLWLSTRNMSDEKISDHIRIAAGAYIASLEAMNKIYERYYSLINRRYRSCHRTAPYRIAHKIRERLPMLSFLVMGAACALIIKSDKKG